MFARLLLFPTLAQALHDDEATVLSAAHCFVRIFSLRDE
jgi:hypothetical protein